MAKRRNWTYPEELPPLIMDERSGFAERGPKLMRYTVVVLIALCGCAPGGKSVDLREGDFALLEFRLRDCTSNDQHLGLEKFLRSLYSTAPQIDLERQMARVRVPEPVKIDLPGIVDGFRRANTGLDSVWVTASGVVSGGRLLLSETKQSLPLVDSVADDPGEKRQTLRVWSASRRR
jgi:hypothetical protein